MMNDIGLFGSLVLVVAGLVLLVISTDRFLDAACATAINLGVPPFIIGLTIVSLGTSAPEIVVSVTAALEGSVELALGNVLGSNIANVGLVLGVTALVAPLPFSRRVMKHELPWLLAATLLTLVCLWDLQLSLLDGMMLLALLGMIAYMLLYKDSGKHTHAVLPQNIESLPQMSLMKSSLYFILGLAVLLISAEMLVTGAAGVARILGASELLIGLTIVAIGTSLPELAATLGSVLKGQTDIAIGNVVGSNLMNLLLVLPIPAILTPFELSSEALYRDYAVMVLLTLLLLIFAYAFLPRNSLSRIEGSVFLGVWLIYNFFLIY